MNNKNYMLGYIYKNVLSGVLAGILISIGGYVNIRCENRFVGSLMFCIGIVMIVTFNLNLYTGKVGYIVQNRSMKFLGVVILTLIGNVIGCVAMGLVLPCDCIYLCVSKVSEPFTALAIKSICCGILMYLSVESFKITGGYIGTILGVVAFILSGFEHSIANTFYFASVRMFSFDVFLFLIMNMVFNAVGALGFCYCNSRIQEKIENRKEWR